MHQLIWLRAYLITEKAIGKYKIIVFNATVTIFYYF